MRGWFPFPWGKSKKADEQPVDVEKYLRSLRVSGEGFIEEEGVTYVKSVNLTKDTAVEDTSKEIDKGNIVILNISDLLWSPVALKDKVNRVREHCVSSGGDMCRISEAKIMIVPRGIEIAYSSLQEGA